MGNYTEEINRRRTFAIISHPDAGKTTLTEKFLLYGGAINLAGSVKGKATARHAVSDWMEIEKERGISVTSSVLQFEYDGYCINILDTPGHQDFSEDTYRTLMAADSAVMVIDASKGVEGRKIVLVSDGGDMRGRIEAAIRDYDIIVLDGSGGPFLYSQSSVFEGLRNKTVVGVNGAVLKTGFQFTPAMQEAVRHAGERFDGAVPEPGGGFRLSNDSLVHNFPSFAMIETLLGQVWDTNR